MDISLRDIKRVRVNDFIYTLRHWRKTFNLFEKLAVVILILLTLVTSWRWAAAASDSATKVPASGGVFIEGVVGNSLDSIDLGRLTKSGLVRLDDKGKVLPDLASKWDISSDKTDYKFTLIPKVSSYVITDVLQKNPTYLPSGVTAQAVDPNTVEFKLTSPSSLFLNSLSEPVFPFGPFKVDKKTSNEIRLKVNTDYHLKKPYFDKLVIRLYPNQSDLQNAANRGNVTGALNLNNIPKNWQDQKVTLNKKHILFLNSSKPYLKSTAIREELLEGEKADSITSLDVLEVNGETVDSEYAALKEKLTKSGIQLNVRKVSLKDALLSDLPKRNYDLLYIMVNEGSSYDPYQLWHSESRSGTGQNFAELANADIDQLCEEFRATDDAGKRQEILDRINQLIGEEKVAIQYKDLGAHYSVSQRVKGFKLSNNLANETDRFNFMPNWYFYQKSL